MSDKDEKQVLVFNGTNHRIHGNPGDTPLPKRGVGEISESAANAICEKYADCRIVNAKEAEKIAGQLAGDGGDNEPEAA